MFRIGNVQRITKYLLICALTLSSECQAAVNRGKDSYFSSIVFKRSKIMYFILYYILSYVSVYTRANGETVISDIIIY